MAGFTDVSDRDILYALRRGLIFAAAILLVDFILIYLLTYLLLTYLLHGAESFLRS